MWYEVHFVSGETRYIDCRVSPSFDPSEQMYHFPRKDDLSDVRVPLGAICFMNECGQPDWHDAPPSNSYENTENDS